MSESQTAMDPEQVRTALVRVPHWQVRGREIHRAFDFADFAAALEFVDRIGALAAEVGHHPQLELGWGHVEVRLSTHSAGGLSPADFELAERVDRL